MSETPGRQAVIRYIEETTPGTTPTNPDLLLHSPEVQSINLGLDAQTKESHDVGDLDVHEFYKVNHAYSCSVEYHLYDEETAERFLDKLARNSDDTPKSYTLEVILDQDAASPHYIRGTGWRVGTVELSGETDSPDTITITYVAGKFADPTTSDPGIGTGSREVKSALTGDLVHFASAAVTLDGSAIATLVGAFDVTFENNIEAKYTTGATDPAVVSSFGPRVISGTADISLDDGAETHWTRVANGTTGEIKIPFGTTTGDDILVLEGVVWPSIDVEVTVDTDIIMGSQPFKAKTFSTDAVA